MIWEEDELPSDGFAKVYTTPEALRTKKDIQSNVEPRIAGKLLTLSSLIYVDEEEESLHIYISHRICIEIFSNRSLRLIDNSAKVAATVNSHPDGQVSLIHPLMRANLVHRGAFELFGVCQPFNNGRFKHIFKMCPDIEHSGCHRIFFTSDELIYTQTALLDVYGLKHQTHMTDFRLDLYENFSMHTAENSSSSDKFTVAQLQHHVENDCKIHDNKDGTTVFVVLGYEIEHDILNGVLTIYDTGINKEVPTIPRIKRMEYSPGKKSMYVYSKNNSYLYANHSEQITIATINGVKASYNKEFLAEFRDRVVTWTHDNEVYQYMK